MIFLHYPDFRFQVRGFTLSPEGPFHMSGADQLLEWVVETIERESALRVESGPRELWAK